MKSHYYPILDKKKLQVVSAISSSLILKLLSRTKLRLLLLLVLFQLLSGEEHVRYLAGELAAGV